MSQIYASAQVDRDRVGQLSVAIQQAFQDLGAFSPGTVPKTVHGSTPREPARADAIDLGDPQASLRGEIEKALEKEIQAHQISIRTAPDGLVISLREIGFFETGSAQLRPQAHSAFLRVVGILRRWPHRLRIEGHTDNLPIHNARFNSNWELSTARATEVVRLLVTEFGFAPDRLSAAGYGEFHPIADNASSDGRSANRRVDIVILSEPKL